jgi:pyruvate dehydrogenase E1 component
MSADAGTCCIPQAAAQELRRDALEGTRAGRRATDYMRTTPTDARARSARFVVLGTDGFGRSDYAVKLRKFFEVDRITCDRRAEGARRRWRIEAEWSAQAIAKYGIDTERPAPWTV